MVLLAIHVAARDGDLVALRRELAKGVSPNAPTRHHGLSPLHLLCGWQRGKSAFSTRSSEGKSADNLEERLACFHALVGAGADIHANDNQTRAPPRHQRNFYPQIRPCPPARARTARRRVLLASRALLLSRVVVGGKLRAKSTSPTRRSTAPPCAARTRGASASRPRAGGT